MLDVVIKKTDKAIKKGENIGMKGRIKMFNCDRGFGFITGENGVEYFFHISNVKSMVDVSRGQIVSFDPGVGQKGPIATNILISAFAPVAPARPMFIALGDTRIKTSNIKAYFLSKQSNRYLRPELCLEIQTYQGEGYFWFESTAPFDIKEKFREIDQIMTS